MSERILQANGITLWTENFGDPNGVPLLLIMGASAQGLYWPDGLVQRLVDQGRFVIRYDNRDTGQSTCFDFAENPYTLDDMTKDAVGVLDGYGLESAHVAGTSMGGMIVQLLAKPDIPTLAVHGTEDRNLPYPHGVALAEAIPGAELVALEGAGHEMPDCYLDQMVLRMVAMQDAVAP